VTEDSGAAAEIARLAQIEQSAASRSANARAVGHGILLMLVTMVFFVAADAIAKYLTRSYPVIEVTWGRFVFHLALLLPFLAARRDLSVFRTKALRLQLTRSLLQIGSTVLYFFGIALLPLATATVIAFAQPLLLTVFSVPLLGEKVGVRRWSAVLIGFLGVLVIVRPGGGASWASAIGRCSCRSPPPPSRPSIRSRRVWSRAPMRSRPASSSPPSPARWS